MPLKVLYNITVYKISLTYVKLVFNDNPWDPKIVIFEGSSSLPGKQQKASFLTKE